MLLSGPATDGRDGNALWEVVRLMSSPMNNDSTLREELSAEVGGRPLLIWENDTWP